MKKFLQVAGGVLLALGLFWGMIGLDYILPAFKKPVDIYDNSLKKMPRYAAVECYIDWVYDCVGTITTKTTHESGVSYKGTDYYYIVPFDIGEEEEYYVALKVSSENHKAYDKIVNSTWNYIDGQSDELQEYQYFTGVIGEVDEKIYQYMCEYFEDVLDQDEIKKYVLPYELKSSAPSNNRKNAIVCLVLLGVGGILLLIGTLMTGKKLPAVPVEKLGRVLGEIEPTTSRLWLSSLPRILFCGAFLVGILLENSRKIFSVPSILEILVLVLVIVLPVVKHSKERAIFYENGISVCGETFLLEDAGKISFRGTSNNGAFQRYYMDTALKTFNITIFEEFEGKYYEYYTQSVL